MAWESSFTPEIGNKICELIASGLSQREAARKLSLDESTVRLWRRTFPDLDTQYVRAREERANGWAEEFIELSDRLSASDDNSRDWFELQKVKLQLDARKWVVSRILSKVYGDRVQQEHSGSIDLGLAERMRLAEERLKK